MYRLEGVIQHYAWGSTSALSDLLGVEPRGRPEAELWFGAHPRGPAAVQLGDRSVGLDRLIADDPVGQLGADHRELPFLAKILAASQPLSIQTHPDREQAEAGFAREQAEGIAVDAFERSFRDRNPKPELICALTPFEALCGFCPPDSSADRLADLDVVALVPLIEGLRGPEAAAVRVERALDWLWSRPGEQAASLVGDVAAASGSGLVRRLQASHPGDIGVLVSQLMHHIELQPGEALFLGPGNLHSYLRGIAVELMVSSDNVVRGGLTTKHIDRAVLMDIVDCTPASPVVQRPDGPVHRYDAMVDDFSLWRIDRAATTLDLAGPAIAVTTDGSVELAAARQRLTLARGQAAWIPAGSAPLSIAAERGQLHLATTGS
ncbi:MAG: mannose-6-phosphate isomerase, class I [Acidimicrobiia bacterium]|nr:mannose-6-phosphate isomerase, class I [Acidimicrobiia bacterium]MDH5237488.1 mannose-6-phosphate isomerase, class I [Acidimicrobiia bacterium]